MRTEALVEWGSAALLLKLRSHATAVRHVVCGHQMLVHSYMSTNRVADVLRLCNYQTPISTVYGAEGPRSTQNLRLTHRHLQQGKWVCRSVLAKQRCTLFLLSVAIINCNEASMKLTDGLFYRPH